MTTEKLVDIEARLAALEQKIVELSAPRPHIPASKRTRWGTPLDLFAKLDAELGPFDLDVCGDDELHVCDVYLTPEVDGLYAPWFGRCYCNPPYGAEGRWIHKALLELAAGRVSRVVFLVPAKTSTKWWHRFVEPAVNAGTGTVRFLPQRLKFRGAASCAPFASAVVVFERR